MDFVLMILAGIWMADGVALLVAPGRMIGLLKATLSTMPSVLHWSWVTALFGVFLLWNSEGLPYTPLWIVAGMGMIIKGIFLAWAPALYRQPVMEWCLKREAIDYRFWGLGLCTLAILLLDALNWLQER